MLVNSMQSLIKGFLAVLDETLSVVTKINTSLLMLRVWLYAALSQEALGNTSLLSAVYRYNIVLT